MPQKHHEARRVARALDSLTDPDVARADVASAETIGDAGDIGDG